MINYCKPIVFVILAVTLSACSVLSPIKQKETLTYLLDVQTIAVKPSSPTNSVLFIADPSAASGFNTNKMAYIEEPYRLRYFTLNRWVDNPSNMLKPLMVNALQNTQHFRAVVSSPYSGSANYRLDTQILRLQQNFMEPQSIEQLTVQVQLSEYTTQRIIAVKQFLLCENAPADTPYGGVIAANLAVKMYLEELAVFVVQHTPDPH